MAKFFTAASVLFASFFAPYQSDYVPRKTVKRRNRATHFVPNGERECTRRLRQIARGEILDFHDEKRFMPHAGASLRLVNRGIPARS